MKFRLVDKITSWTRWDNICGIKAVSFEEYSLKESFGDPPRLPELLLLESLLQLGNWLVILSSDFEQTGVVARLSEVRFHSFLLPGEQLELGVRVTRRRKDGFEMTGGGHVQGRSVITGFGCLASVAPLASYQNPADLRVLFSEIYEPTALGASASLPAPLGTPASLSASPSFDQYAGKGGTASSASGRAGRDAGAPGEIPPAV